MPSTVQSVTHATAPTAAAGAGAGTSPTVAIVSGSSDTAGTVTLTTGTTPAAGVLATVTFGVPFKTAPKVVLLTQVTNPASATALAPIATTIGTSSFKIETTATPTASKAYVVAYLVVPEDGEGASN